MNRADLFSVRADLIAEAVDLEDALREAGQPVPTAHELVAVVAALRGRGWTGPDRPRR